MLLRSLRRQVFLTIEVASNAGNPNTYRPPAIVHEQKDYVKWSGTKDLVAGRAAVIKIFIAGLPE